MSGYLMWFIFATILIIAEIFTAGFFVACIGIAAIFSGIIAWIFPHNYILQWVVFILGNFIMFVYIRRMVIKYLYKTEKEVKTNIYGIIGKEGMVIEKISPENPGYVKIYGDRWRAITSDDAIIEKGEKVKIIKVEGNTVTVEKIEGE